MRVLLAPDGFGGTLSAAQAAAALADGWRRHAPHDDLDLAPLSDGGPGLVEVLSAAKPEAQLLPVTVQDPLGRPVSATVLLDGATAYVESAQACGLHLLEELAPRTASSYGVGQLVGAARDAGAARVVVGLGGSATTDGGAGLLHALGARLLDAAGRDLPPGGAALRDLHDLHLPAWSGTLVAATDVDAPLLGIHGAAAVFGPQKGASRADVLDLDDGLRRLVDLLEPLTRPVRDLPGAGAAGGLGAALLALGAERTSGLELVRDAVGLADRVAAADLVVTGEGRIDMTSLRGKVVGGVAALAQESGVPCVVLAGQAEVGRREVAAAGVEEVHAVADLVGLEAALGEPAESLARLAARVAQQWSRA